jgi:ring-1,2-phenylacetyl-CoA epoxidase subunit PaaD
VVNGIERRVREALTNVVDPEIPACSVLDLGMIERVEARDETVEIDVLPTFVGCPAIEMIGRDVEAAATEVAPGKAVHVRFLYDPPWTTDRITEQGRERLREFGIAPEWKGGPPERTVVPLLSAASTPCPYCGSPDTVKESSWGPTPCRTQHWCRACRNPFEGFKEKSPGATASAS